MPTTPQRPRGSRAVGLARRIASTLSVLATACVLSSCSDSPLGNSGDALNDEEIQDLFGILTELSFSGSDSARAGVFNRTVFIVEDCPDGFFSVQGLIEGDGESGDEYEIAGDVELDFFRCQTRSSAPYLTLDVDRPIRGRYTVARADGITNYAVNLDGSILFTTDDGRSGRCAVDLLVSFQLGLGPEDLLAEGSICGRQGSTLGNI